MSCSALHCFFHGRYRLPLILLAIVSLLSLGDSSLLAQQRASSATREAEWFHPEADSQSLQSVLEDEFVSDRWFYQDLNAARAKAKETGKPLLVVFRCVPCGAAPGLDGAVCTAGGAEASQFEAEMRAAGGDLSALLDKFVAVRMVKMNGVNRHVFQFDRDVPYVAVMLHADGTLYGRYGTRVSPDRKNLQRHNLASFQKALERGLALHAAYPANERQLASKRAEVAEAPLAEKLDTFRPFPPEHNPKVKNCIHCHTVGEAEMRTTIAAGRLELRDVWPFPLPENLGIKIDVNDGLKVQSVKPDSPAHSAAIRPGDELVSIAGQPLTSEADIQWALHYAPDTGVLPMQIRRAGEINDVKLTLAADWRKSDGYWRASLAPLRPDVHLRPDPYREKKGAKPGSMGLTVHYPQEAAAKAGLRNGDLLIEVDGRRDLHWEADVLKHLLFDRSKAKTSQWTILRNGQELKVTLPIR